MLLPRLKDCKILSSWVFLITFCKIVNINVSTYNKFKIKIKKFVQNQIKVG